MSEMRDHTDFEALAEAVLPGLSPRGQAVVLMATLLGLRSDDGSAKVEEIRRALAIPEFEWESLASELYERAALFYADAPENTRVMTTMVSPMAYVALGSGGRPSPKEWRRLRSIVMERDGGEANACCVYCFDTDGPFVVDHLHPVARGGSNHPLNLVLACEDCNSRKGAMPWSDWVKVFERLRQVVP